MGGERGRWPPTIEPMAGASVAAFLAQGLGLVDTRH
jgi:hypothetical protein